MLVNRGAVLDEFLSWDAHVNKLCKKLVQTNGILFKLRHYVPQKTCISGYFSFVFPFFYGSLAWQFTSKTNHSFKPTRLFILQKKCLRTIMFSFNKDHSNPLFKDLKLHKGSFKKYVRWGAGGRVIEKRTKTNRRMGVPSICIRSLF